MTDVERIENSRNNLEMIVRGGKIILDSTACMHEKFSLFLSNIVPILTSWRKCIVIFDKTLSELQTVAHSSNQENARRAKKAVEDLQRLSSANLLVVMKLQPGMEIEDKIEDFRGKVNQTFITQDNVAAQKILHRNRPDAKIEVRQINKYGFLSQHRLPESTTPKKEVHVKPQFHVVSDENMYRGSFTGFKNIKKYQEGETVYILANSNKGAVVLERKIAEGGEGAIYSVKNIDNIIIKLFQEENVSDQRAFYSRKKVQMLLDSTLQNNAICFPSAGVYDSNGNMIGYAMEKAEGIMLSRLLAGSQQTIKQYFGEATTRKETVQMCITFLKAVKYLHDNNIIVGDLRPENIIVKSPEKITIIDTDSFQLNEFPCPVGVDLYTAPERIQQKGDIFSVIDKSTFMRKKSDDTFAVATILFQILMPGKEPYAKQDGSGRILEDIKLGDFAYAPPGGGKETTAQAPKGNWRYCWSHVNYRVRMMMYETFRKGEAHYAPEKRYTVDDWLRVFQNYYDEIVTGKTAAYDPMSLELIPIRFIRQKDAKYGKCKNPKCKLDIVSENDLKRYHGYCYRCAHTTILYDDICPICQENEIVYYLIDQLKGIPRPTKCEECHKKELDSVFETRLCTSCGRQFDITVREKNWVEKKGYKLPRRCLDCRKAEKDAEQQAIPPVISYPAPEISTPKPAPYLASRQESFWERLKKIIGI